MAPERSPKRQKTATDSQPASSSSVQEVLPPATPGHDTSNSAERLHQRSSWYASWSRKAPPITQIAHESIQSASNTASDAASSIKSLPMPARSVRSPPLAMTLGKGRSSRASLADATTTKVHAEVKSPGQEIKRTLSAAAAASADLQGPRDDGAKADDSGANTDVKGKETEQPAKKEGEPSVKEETDPSTTITQQALLNSRTSWLSWLGKDASTQDAIKDDPAETVMAVESQPALQPSVRVASTSESSQPQGAPVAEVQANRRSWLPIWSNENAVKSQNHCGSDEPAQRTAEEPLPQEHDNRSQDVNKNEMEQTTQTEADASVVEAVSASAPPHDNTKASAWAFWSRERRANGSTSSVDKPREGEIAVSDTPSQDKPRKASMSVPKSKASETSETSGPKEPPVSTGLLPEEEGSKSLKADSTKNHKKQDSRTEVVASRAETSNAAAKAIAPAESTKPVSTTLTKASNNLLLPAFHATLKLPETPSILLRLASLLYTIKEPELKHLSLVKDPPRIKNALAIGVHGYFPAPLIRTVLGQPTGTSIKFADMAAKSIKRWTSAHGYECQVKTAALEGEGKISERLELLWKLLLNWIEEIRKSDFIMIACHSQGVPVAIMLVAKLIQFGCVNAARIGICAMAGVNMGPFPEYKSRWIGGSAGELFDFSNPASRVSTDYLAALEVVLKFGVRLTFVGSIDDQLVSLESSIYSPISHPHIFRAVSIDARVHAPNFLSHLVGFALKLRNLGVQDHGLIRELSSPLAGSLYSGEGHSRIYEDDAVYDLAIAFSLETSSLAGTSITQRSIVAGGSNPYILPFAMRGILEEDFVKNELQGEASTLLQEFDDWKPTSKVLKDVKFRLEGIRSKL